MISDRAGSHQGNVGLIHWSLSMNPLRVGVFALLVVGLTGPAATASTLFWSDFADNEILSGNLDGTGQTVISPGFNPGGVVVGAGKVFWTSPNVNEIFSVNLDGTGVKTFALPGPASDVAFFDNKLYWSDFADSEILSGNLDGTGQTVISPGFNPGGIVVGAGKVFWTSPNVNEIFSVNLNGTGVKTFALPGPASDVALLTSSPTIVPEPTTWALILLGFAGLGYAGYRKAKSARVAVSAGVVTGWRHC
jgi:hypothetical protein